jgi:predicted transcriptional regulator
MSDAEKINEKLDEVKEAIENIDIPDTSNLGLIINESLTVQVSRIERQLIEINNSLKNITQVIRELRK